MDPTVSYSNINVSSWFYRQRSVLFPFQLFLSLFSLYYCCSYPHSTCFHQKLVQLIEFFTKLISSFDWCFIHHRNWLIKTKSTPLTQPYLLDFFIWVIKITNLWIKSSKSFYFCTIWCHVIGQTFFFWFLKSFGLQEDSFCYEVYYANETNKANRHKSRASWTATDRPTKRLNESRARD